MSKYGPCHRDFPDCGPAVAVVVHDGHWCSLCKACLDMWFDCADDEPEFEPEQWYWLAAPRPNDDMLRAALRDPQNRAQVAQIIREDARRDPTWLRAFLRKEARITGTRLAPW